VTTCSCCFPEGSADTSFLSDGALRIVSTSEKEDVIAAASAELARICSILSLTSCGELPIAGTAPFKEATIINLRLVPETMLTFLSRRQVVRRTLKPIANDRDFSYR
jgi:hypothetical protein